MKFPPAFFFTRNVLSKVCVINKRSRVKREIANIGNSPGNKLVEGGVVRAMGSVESVGKSFAKVVIDFHEHLRHRGDELVPVAADSGADVAFPRALVFY